MTYLKQRILKIEKIMDKIKKMTYTAKDYVEFIKQKRMDKISRIGMENIVTELERVEKENIILKEEISKLQTKTISLPFPDDYEDVKDSYLDFMETAMMIDVKMIPMDEVVDKTDRATDKFAKYLLRL